MTLSPEEVRVFVSYSHETPLHDLLVQSIAVGLKAAGFEVFLDTRQEIPPNSWLDLIERELPRADVVLCVCTPTYAARVDGEIPGGVGRGVAQEAALVRAEIYEQKMRADRFRVVQLDGSALEIPTILGGMGTHVFRWPTDQASLVETLKVPTKRRRIQDALREVFRSDVEALGEWAQEFLKLSRDPVLDFDVRARRVAKGLMTHSDATVTKQALEELVARVSKPLGESLDVVAKVLQLGTLKRSSDDEELEDDSGAEPRTPTGPLTDKERADYLQAVHDKHGATHFLGFDMPFEHAIEWEELYVELEMVKDYDPETRDDFMGRKDGKKTVALDGAFGYAKRRKKLGMVLLGNPGSGKTTQLRQMLLRVLDDARGPSSLGLEEGTVPMLVPLHQIGPLPEFEELPSLKEMVGRALPKSCGISEELAVRLLAQPRVLYLLDGLDEITDPQQRARMVTVISHALDGLGEDALFVSSRYAGVEELRAQRDNRLLELCLQPLDDEQVERLVLKWHHAVEVKDADDDEREPSPEAASQRAQALLHQLRAPEFTSQDRLVDMAQTPLLLTALCLIHRDRGTRGLPTDRSEIYRICEEILLQHWLYQGKRRTPRERWARIVDGRRELFSTTMARRVLQRAAFWLHTENERDAPASALSKPVGRGLADVGRPDVPAEEFVRSFASESGLLTPYGPQTHGLIHLGFQEHLAALHVQERWEAEPEVLAGWSETWWREVARMALTDGPRRLRVEFMRKVVEGPHLPAWSRTRTLARCLKESPAESLDALEGVLKRERVGEEDESRLLASIRLLVHGVRPQLPNEVSMLDTWLREHPVDSVRRRWLGWVERATMGKPRVVEKAGIELMPIPAGWFSMGSPVDDEAAFGPEHPQHEVDIEAFWLAKTPVTNAQYRRFLESDERPGDVKDPEYWDRSEYNQDEQPVVGISWYEAKAYCEWAGLSLPTEAQWEYACRAGTTTRYYSGDDEADLNRVGWYRGNSGGRLHSVGELEPNGFGLYDMHGNVYEWCEDAFESYITSARGGDGLRKKPAGAANRVGRGGYFRLGARNARSAYRNYNDPGNRWRTLGFRPAQGHL